MKHFNNRIDVEVHNSIMQMYASDEQNANISDGHYDHNVNVRVDTGRVTPCYGSTGYMRQ